MTWEQEIQLAAEDAAEKATKKATEKERERSKKIIAEKDRIIAELQAKLAEKK